MQVIPLSTVPSQDFTVQLNGQTCSINLYQKSTGLFFDLNLNGVQIVTAMLCLHGVSLVQQTYLGFVGTLMFIDTEGVEDPFYTGLGARFILTYA